MARGKKKQKKKTHVKTVLDADIPRSFVIKSGETSNATTRLVRDFRSLMEPNTATNLKERRGNKIKDFLMVAGQLSVSHLIVFSDSGKQGINMRIGRIPKGPTLTFHVERYSLVNDCLKLQARPKSPGSEFHTSPLVVLNNFSENEKLMATMLQNMFPPIKVTKMKLADAKRIVLFNFNKDTGLVEMRHYRITVKTLGISKSVKTIIQTQVPDLRGYDDISDFIMRGAFASESDVEDAPEAAVTIPRADVSEKRAIKLFELGPRLDLKLIKIQDGLCGGEVIHHAFIQKTDEEIKELKNRKDRERAERDRRRAEQERNVKLKELKKKPAEANDQEEIDFNQEDFDDLMETDSEDGSDEDGGEDAEDQQQNLVNEQDAGNQQDSNASQNEDSDEHEMEE